MIYNIQLLYFFGYLNSGRITEVFMAALPGSWLLTGAAHSCSRLLLSLIHNLPPELSNL